MSRSYSIYYYKSLSSGNCHNNKDKLGPDDINFFHTAFPYQIMLIAPLNICLQLQLIVLAVQCFWLECLHCFSTAEYLPPPVL